MDFYKELLTYDMYLRENLKSRPAFAENLREDDKEFIRNFYKEEERERSYLPAYREYDWKQLSKMTHLEPFRYPVWGEGQPGILDCAYVLFDYNDRNPLTYEAKTYVVKPL
jgi:hypothetical protein